MDLLTLTRRRLFALDLEATQKRTVLEELLDFLIDAGEVPKEARSDTLAAILAREERLSTGIVAPLEFHLEHDAGRELAAQLGQGL